MKAEESIQRTKQGFEESFAAGSFYNKQTRDEEHLQAILNFIEVNAGMKILDLGTGTGFLAFAIAKMCPEAEVVGLDIVEKALENNRLRAKEQKIENLTFINYDGTRLPFEAGSFDLVVSRYALHHFPVIEGTFLEIGRVLRTGGRFFVSDPAPNEEDTGRFVDAYMQMKPDGHIKFYTKDEWQELSMAAGLSFEKEFPSTIRFPKKRETAVLFEEILERFDPKKIKGYELAVTEDEIWITEKVNNILFQKN